MDKKQGLANRDPQGRGVGLGRSHHEAVFGQVDLFRRATCHPGLFYHPFPSHLGTEEGDDLDDPKGVEVISAFCHLGSAVPLAGHRHAGVSSVHLYPSPMAAFLCHQRTLHHAEEEADQTDQILQVGVVVVFP